MPDEQDWVADTEGNLRAPGDGEPPTDEFGRDDPESLERERRRRERQARRGKQPPEPTATAEAPRPAKRPETTEPVAPPPSVDGNDGAEAPPRRPRGRYRRRRIIALALVLVGVLLAWFLVALFQPPPFDPGNGSGEAIVTVPEGASASQVADLLSDNDVVSNGTLFEWRLKLAGKTDQILPGRYVLAHNMSYSDAIDKLTSSGGKINVTIPEGEDRTQIAATVGDLGLSGDYLVASKSSKGFDPNRYGAQNPKSLEGFLFPATYALDRRRHRRRSSCRAARRLRENIAGVDLATRRRRT